jgi:hypothetical protein
VLFNICTVDEIPKGKYVFARLGVVHHHVNITTGTFNLVPLIVVQPNKIRLSLFDLKIRDIPCLNCRGRDSNPDCPLL